ncbi:MAG: hypothetical protein WD872_06525 [Pirellulaceae bacterium]
MSELQGMFSWRMLWVVVGLGLVGLLASLSREEAPEVDDSVASPSANRPLARDRAPGDSPAIGDEPQIAPLGPLVADNIQLDPSITETPSLPAKPHAELLEFPETASADNARGRRPSLEQDFPQSLISQSEVGPITEPPPSSIRPEPAPEPEIPPTKAWPLALGLIEQLDRLAVAVPAAAPWAARVQAEAQSLAQLGSLVTPAAAEVIGRLDRLADEAKTSAAALPADSRSKLLRAGYAVVRRVVIWDLAHQLAIRGDAELAPVVDRDAWIGALAGVDRQLADTGAAANWRKYLRLDEAHERFDSATCSPGDQRDLARDILHRMHSTQLSHDQSRFLKTPAFAAFTKQLHDRAAETPDLVALLDAIERHERDGLAAESQGLAEQYDLLRWSSDDGVKELVDTVNAYYRNANVRVALSAELVNRMLPRAQPQYEPVQDTIQGAWVEGDSQTSTKLRIVLTPDQSRWNIGLEAQGEVASNTASSKGPATFYQDGVSFFRARKRVLVDRRGIRLQNAEADANANNNLSDFETDFDGIPLFGNLVRAIARNQYEVAQPAAKVEVEGKIVWRATNQLDREVAAKLEQSKRDFQTKLLDPLRKLQLEPTAVDLETTADRLIARYRLAGRDQVAAHTPRPQAPGDSLLSVQIHESALNNVLEQLKLHGRRYELRELYEEITAHFTANPEPIPDDLPHDVYVTFATENPVSVDCQDGRVRLTIRLQELAQEGTRNQWHDFAVRGYYAPVANQLDANLEREGVIELIGNRLRFGDQIALRGIFGKVLSRNRKLNLVNKQIAQAPELTDQQVTQFVIHDGWIGVALGPKSPGRAVAMQPRPNLKSKTR